MRLENPECLTKAEWISTHIGVGIVIAVGLLLEEVPREDWQQTAEIFTAALLSATLVMAGVRFFSRKPVSACVALKAEVNRNVPL